MPLLNPDTDDWHGIFKVMEECAELVGELARLSHFPDGNHPNMYTLQPKPALLVCVENELADVLAACQWFLQQHHDRLDGAAIIERMAFKLLRFETEFEMVGVPMRERKRIPTQPVPEGPDPQHQILTSTLLSIAGARPEQKERTT